MEDRASRFASTGPLASAPTAPGEREAWLDALRGLALFGILWVNIASFSSPFFYSESAEIRLFSNPVSLQVEWWRGAIAEGKFYPLFSWLFGLGIGWQLTRGWSESRVRRRMGILALFGLYHAVLLYHGDVLLAYAGLGLIVVAFARLADSTIRRWALLLLATPLVILGLFALLLSLVPPQEWARMQAADAVTVHQYVRVMQAGDFGEILTYRVRDYLRYLRAGFG